MKRRAKAIFIVCAVAVSIGCVGCASFSRRFVSEQDVTPERWHIFGEAFGYANAGLLTKLTDRGVVIRLQASRLPESEVVGRIVEASVTVAGNTLSHSNANTRLSRRSELILNEMTDGMPVQVDVPGRVDQLDLTVVLEFADPEETSTHRKTTTLSLPKSETMHWRSPLEFWFGPIL